MRLSRGDCLAASATYTKPHFLGCAWDRAGQMPLLRRLVEDIDVHARLPVLRLNRKSPAYTYRKAHQLSGD